MEESRFFEARWFLGFSILELKMVITQLIACLRDTRRLIITEQTAEETIRLSFSHGGIIDVTGTDVQTGQPRTVAIWYEEVWRAIRD
jgi:actin-like ATPase involved in cell morphogenesis